MAAKGVDDAAARGRGAIAAFGAVPREYPTASGLGPQFEQLVAAWRPAMAETGDA